jgi:hypothetical protein
MTLLIRLVNLPANRQSIIAIAFALIAIVLPALFLAMLASVLISQSNEIHDLRIRAGKLAALAALKDDTVEMQSQPENGAAIALLITGENLPIAKANLQSRFNAIVAAHGGSVASSGDVPDVTDKGLLLIGMRADISGTNEAIEGVLSDIESSKPPLMVRELMLRSEGAPPSDRPMTLTASFKLYGAIKPFVPDQFAAPQAEPLQ